MTPSGIRASKLWIWVHIVVILSCGAMALCPTAWHLPAFIIPFGCVLMPLYFYLHVRSLKEDKTADLPIGELYAQVKGGRRLPRSALETAAAIALLLATICSLTGRG